MSESSERRPLSRRRFLHLSLLTSGVALGAPWLAACQQPAAGPRATSSGADAPAAGAAAQPARKPTTVAEIALYQGADREQLLLEGAQAEGKLVFYNSLTWMETVSREFERKYPFVKVDMYRSDSSDIATRLVNEYKAGRVTADVVETTAETLDLLNREGILQEYWSPELRHYPPETMHKGATGVHYWGDRENHIGLGFNTTLVSAAEAPRTLDDLLDPRWRGKMSIAGTSTGINWLGMLLDVKGQTFVDRLGAQEIRVQNISGAALAGLVVSGEVPLSPTIFDANVHTARERGAPVEWRPLEPVISNLGYSTLTTKAQHPHAAMLFLEYLHSREGQEVMMKGGLDSPREDLASPEQRFQKYYIHAKFPLAEYERRYAEWERLMRQLFIRAQ